LEFGAWRGVHGRHDGNGFWACGFRACHGLQPGKGSIWDAKVIFSFLRVWGIDWLAHTDALIMNAKCH
jgi:hypothetical protein